MVVVIFQLLQLGLLLSHILICTLAHLVPVQRQSALLLRKITFIAFLLQIFVKFQHFLKRAVLGNFELVFFRAPKRPLTVGLVRLLTFHIGQVYGQTWLKILLILLDFHSKTVMFLEVILRSRIPNLMPLALLDMKIFTYIVLSFSPIFFVKEQIRQFFAAIALTSRITVLLTRMILTAFSVV